MIIFVDLVWAELLGCVRRYVLGGGGRSGGKLKGKMEHIEKFHLSGVFELGCWNGDIYMKIQLLLSLALVHWGFGKEL